MNTVSPGPIDAFLAARAAFERGLFEDAQRLRREYLDSVAYEDFPRSDRREPRQVDVSIVIVSFEGRENLLRCVDAILEIDDPGTELIVVDNGGNESVVDRLDERPLLRISPPANLLPSEGRNAGASFARGTWIAFVDDDAVVDRRFVAAIRLAWQTADFSAIRGRVLPLTGEANNQFVGHYDLGPYPIPAVLMTEGNMAMPADRFKQVGGFDSILFGAEGTELTHRLHKRFDDLQTYYWPGMTIFHDFAAGATLARKKERHAIARRYFAFLDPDINRLQRRFGRWYRTRPGPGSEIDARSTGIKVLVYAQERLISMQRSLRNLMRRTAK